MGDSNNKGLVVTQWDYDCDICFPFSIYYMSIITPPWSLRVVKGLSRFYISYFTEVALEVKMFDLVYCLSADGEVVTIDQDDYLKTLVEDSFLKKSPHGYKIKIIIGKGNWDSEC